MGQNGEALRTLKTAFEGFPRNVRFHHCRGKALGACGRGEEARSSLRRALDVRPDASRARLERASLLQAMGRLDEALVVHDESFRILPRNASIRAAAAKFWVDRGEGDRALELLDAGLRQQPEDVVLAALRIRILAVDGDPAVRDVERARRLVEQLLDGRHAQDPRALSAAAVVAAERGDLARAIELARSASARALEAGADVLKERIEAELTGYRARPPHRDD